MKIIELVEKQRNNEILPKHIRYENEDLYFDGIAYFDKEENNDLLDILAMNGSALTHLYDEVEIIEEDKKIERFEMCTGGIMGFDGVENITSGLKDKINELIDEVNRLKNKEK